METAVSRKIVLLSGCLVAGAGLVAKADPAASAGVYPTLSAYVEKALGSAPEGYTCVISQADPDVKACKASSASGVKKASRTFGMFYMSSAVAESGFLFIAEQHGKTLSVVESRPFHVTADTLRYGWGVEDFVADSNDSFHLQTTSGSASMPDSDVFRFKLIKGHWWLSGHDHKTLSRCPDESIAYGSGYSINFLTRKARIEIRRDCTHVKTEEHQLATHAVPWASFDPSDPLLGLGPYGKTWY